MWLNHLDFFQKSMFCSSLTAEGLQNTKNAFPPSMGITKKNASHRAWGWHFSLLQHPYRENANSDNCSLQHLMLNWYIWNIKNSNIPLEVLKKSKHVQIYSNIERLVNFKMCKKPLVGARFSRTQPSNDKRLRLPGHGFPAARQRK